MEKRASSVVSAAVGDRKTNVRSCDNGFLLSFVANRYGDMPSRGFPTTLPDFQRVFPDDAACAAYLDACAGLMGYMSKM